MSSVISPAAPVRSHKPKYQCCGACTRAACRPQADPERPVRPVATSSCSLFSSSAVRLRLGSPTPPSSRVTLAGTAGTCVVDHGQPSRKSPHQMTRLRMRTRSGIPSSSTIHRRTAARPAAELKPTRTRSLLPQADERAHWRNGGGGCPTHPRSRVRASVCSRIPAPSFVRHFSVFAFSRSQSSLSPAAPYRRSCTWSSWFPFQPADATSLAKPAAPRSVCIASPSRREARSGKRPPPTGPAPAATQRY
ncbi:hypothetical protein C8Q80DRAFT_519072 [Daedaleopsis nitida]|nr:hypothetical protein C8Q80DRAFT_519072 [Daedaleopsis nitida]